MFSNTAGHLRATLWLAAFAITSGDSLLKSSIPTVIVLHPAAFFFAVPLPPPNTTGSIGPTGGQSRVDWDRTLREQLSALPTGKRVFNPPNQMQEGTNTRVEFRVSTGDVVSLVSGLQGPGTPEIRDIRIAPVMAVTLKSEEESGEPIFRIKPLKDSDEQVVVGDQPTEWSWDVFPTRTGSHRLYLTVSVFLFPPEGGPRKQIKVEERVIAVRINAPYRISRYSGTIFTFLTGGFGLWLLQKLWPALMRWRERRRPRIILDE